IAIEDHLTNREYRVKLRIIDGLDEYVERHIPGIEDADEQLLWMEFALHGLAEYSKIGRQVLDNRVDFKDYSTPCYRELVVSMMTISMTTMTTINISAKSAKMPINRKDRFKSVFSIYRLVPSENPLFRTSVVLHIGFANIY